MHLTTDIRCLVVEDDKFKLDDILIFLREELGRDAEIVSCSASSTAMAELGKKAYDIAIVDMAIPSHPAFAGDGSPFPFPKGGLDVLFEIDALGYKCITIVLTQYPEVEIDGCLIPVDLATEEMADKFEIEVAGCFQYFEGSQDWKTKISNILKKQ